LPHKSYLPYRYFQLETSIKKPVPTILVQELQNPLTISVVTQWSRVQPINTTPAKTVLHHREQPNDFTMRSGIVAFMYVLLYYVSIASPPTGECVHFLLCETNVVKHTR